VLAYVKAMKDWCIEPEGCFLKKAGDIETPDDYGNTNVQ
jgi:hypothetical protein